VISVVIKTDNREREREREIKKQTLDYREHSAGTRGEVGEGWGKQVMGMKECTCRDEHWVRYGSADSLYLTI